MSDPQKMSAILRYDRKTADLSQHELARLAGVGKTVVCDLEKGKETVQLDTLRKILVALNMLLFLPGLLQFFCKAHTVFHFGILSVVSNLFISVLFVEPDSFRLPFSRLQDTLCIR